MAFITEIANHIKKNYDLSKESLTIIFPNKRAALKLRTELKDSKLETNIWLPQLLSIQEAMCSWSGMQLLDNIDITFELIKILNNFNKITSNDIFGLASQMLKDFDEIDQYELSGRIGNKYAALNEQGELLLPAEYNGKCVKCALTESGKPASETLAIGEWERGVSVALTSGEWTFTC
jgi:hypothetical protein